MGISSKDRLWEVRELCGRAAWPEVLAYARKWHAERPTEAKAVFYQGVALAAMGRFTEAETVYRRVVKLDQTDFMAWNNLAALLSGALNRGPEGVQCLAQALKVDPGNKQGWASLAGMNSQLGRHQQAMECAECALALDPQMVEAQLHRARSAQVLGQMEIVRAASEALARVPPEQFHRAM
jgi:tetratricopeptide (TPR) repeat protein